MIEYETPFDRQMQRKRLRDIPVVRQERTMVQAHDQMRLYSYVRTCVPLRGTREWEARERARMELNNWCLSFGPLPENARVYRNEG